MKASAKDLRFHSSELLDFVAKGEEVTITYRGKPCAKLVPLEQNSNKDVENELFAMWADHHDLDDVDAYVRNKRKGREF